jgi:murein DD-endopeptidase MepM/ murein hydrolase activator NlpD
MRFRYTAHTQFRHAAIHPTCVTLIVVSWLFGVAAPAFIGSTAGAVSTVATAKPYALQPVGRLQRSEVICAQSASPWNSASRMTHLALSDAPGPCESEMARPLEYWEVTNSFVAPAQPWLSGHRGLDLRASEGDEVLAPQTAVISFAGKVAGKDVVSLRSGNWLHSFEPATTDKAPGELVEQSSPFAVVGGNSDHCETLCLHWGVRDAANEYRNPEILLRSGRITLKAW